MRTPTRRHSFLALLILAAGCGGDTTSPPQPAPPRLEAAAAERLAAKSDEIADALEAGDICTAAVRADELMDETVRAIDEGAVPRAYQEDLQARVNELVNEVNCPPPPEEEEDEEEGEEQDGEGEGKGKGKGKGKDKGNGEDELLPTLPTEPTP